MRLRQLNVSGGGSISRRVMRIVVDSAAIYSLNHLLYAVLYEAKTNVESTPSFLVSFVAHCTNVKYSCASACRKQV